MGIGRGSRGGWVSLLSTCILILSTAVDRAPPTSGQMSACTTAMLASLMPCASFLTGSGASSPVASCCKAVGDLMSTSSDCSCMLFSQASPVGFALASGLPINRTLAVQLPSICGSSRVPLLNCNSSSIPGRIPLPPIGSIVPSPPPPPPVVGATPPPVGGGVKPFAVPSGADTLRRHNSAMSLMLLLVPPLIMLWSTTTP